MYRFVFIVERRPTPSQVATLSDQGAHLPLAPGPRESGCRVLFERAESGLVGAVVSAVCELEAAGLRPVRLVDHDWVTLADVADRIGRSREAVRLWAVGRNGPAGFPPPVNPGRDTLFYSWAEVSWWLRDRLDLPVPVADAVLPAANLALRLRTLAPRIPGVERIRELATPYRADGVSGPTGTGT